MNIKSFISFLKTRNGALTAGAAMVSIAAVAFLIMGVLRTTVRLRDDAAGRVQFLQAKVAKYKNIAGLIPQLEKGKIRLQNAVAGEQFNFSTEPTEQSTVDHLSRLFNQANVRLNRMKSVPERPFTWDISFSAGYRGIREVLGLLEKFFRIETIAITGSPSGEHTVEATVTSLLRPEDVRALRNGGDAEQDIFDVYDRVNGLLTALESRKQEESAAPAGKDLFTPNAAPEPVKAVVKTREPKAKMPEIIVEGILWDPGHPLVIINGRTMGEGDTVDGAVITSIFESGIKVRVKSQIFTIKMEKRS